MYIHEGRGKKGNRLEREREERRKENTMGTYMCMYISFVYMEDFTRENTSTMDDQTIVASME